MLTLYPSRCKREGTGGIYIPPLEEEVDSTKVEDGGVQNISRIKIYRTAIDKNRPTYTCKRA